MWRTRDPMVRLPRLLLPAAVALLVVPIHSGGYNGWPWNPRTIDLAVYRHGVDVLLAGGDVLTSTVPGADLVFTYPPFALCVLLPLAWVPWPLLQVLWTVASALVLYAVLHRLGLRGWWPSLVTAVLVAACEPVRSTLILGQINLFLMAVVLVDLAVPTRRSGPDRADTRQDAVRARLRGVATGVTTAIKLTPGLFGVMAAFARDWRLVRNFAIAAATCTVGAAVILPSETVGWLQSLVAGDTRAGNLEGQINQSVLGAVVRAVGFGRPQYLAGLVLAAAVGLAGAYVAAKWYRERPVLGVCLAAVAALLASPISWDHHFVWVVPLGVALWDRSLPLRLRVVGWAYVGWLGSGLYTIGSPVRGAGRLDFEPWQVVVGAVGPLLGIALLTVAFTVVRWRPAEARSRQRSRLMVGASTA